MRKITSGAAPSACTSRARATSGVTTAALRPSGQEIIKHSACPADQLRETLPAMWCGLRVVQPGVEPRGVVGANLDQRSAGPCSEVAFAQVVDRFGGSAKTYRSGPASLLRSAQPGCDSAAQPPGRSWEQLARVAEHQGLGCRRFAVGNYEQPLSHQASPGRLSPLGMICHAMVRPTNRETNSAT